MSKDQQDKDLISTRPYLLRAIHEWALDNGLTPQILVAADVHGVEVPRQYVNDSQIILNIHPRSVSGLEMGNEYVMFSARFDGKPMNVSIPITAVNAIYTRENGQGIVFQSEQPDDSPPPSDAMDSSVAAAANKSHLRVIK